MMEKSNPPQCPHCGATLIQKVGKKGAFYTCPNWNSDGSGCEGTIWFPPKQGNPQMRGAVKEHDQGEKIILLLTGIEARIIKLQTEIEELAEHSVIYPPKGEEDNKI